MDLSIFLARILGPFFCVLGLAALFHRETIQKAALEILGNPALLFMSGTCRLLFGLILIGIHNLWVQSWEVVITILGWLLILKGIFTLLLPKATMEIGKPWAKKDGLFQAFGLIALLVGIFFLYEGYAFMY